MMPQKLILEPGWLKRNLEEAAKTKDAVEFAMANPDAVLRLRDA